MHGVKTVFLSDKTVLLKLLLLGLLTQWDLHGDVFSGLSFLKLVRKRIMCSLFKFHEFQFMTCDIFSNYCVLARRFFSASY